MGVDEGNVLIILLVIVEEDRRGRPDRYLQLNTEQPKHHCSPESISRQRAAGSEGSIAQRSKRQEGGYGLHVRNLYAVVSPINSAS